MASTTDRQSGPPPSPIALRLPSKYRLAGRQPANKSQPAPFHPPPLDWLCRTWCVTHSTLAMWRSARNVRITYKALPSQGTSSAAGSGSGSVHLDDLVEYEGKSPTALKRVEGVDKPDPGCPGAWDWRGKGWLKIASSHWEVLGWGERRLAGSDEVERWVVTWFAATLFTSDGLDLYSDRPGGLSRETVDGIMNELSALDAPQLVALVSRDMRVVEIRLPWLEK